MPARPSVSVVVTARSTTLLGRTLRGLTAQTRGDWEALVVGWPGALPVDDPRIRVVAPGEGGVWAARNAGLAAAEAAWVLFVDGGDWLAAGALDRLLATASASDPVDAFYGDALAASPPGVPASVIAAPEPVHLFATCAERSPFPLHACLVRTEVLRRAAGFDTSLLSHAGWDVWQRLARGGARFRRVPEPLAVCGPPEAEVATSGDEDRAVAEALRIIDRGHNRDPRVTLAAATCADGMPRARFPAAAYGVLVGQAAARLGRGAEARAVLDLAPPERPVDLDGGAIALALFEGIAGGAGVGVEAWMELWPRVEAAVGDFLAALEERSGLDGLAREVTARLEELVLTRAPWSLGAESTDGSPDYRPLFAGSSAAVRIHAGRPVAGVDVGAGIERLLLRVERGGREIGGVWLPGGSVSQEAVAAEVGALIDRASGPLRPPPSRDASGAPSPQQRQTPFDRAHFESLFASADPWDAGSDYERVKAARTLSLLPGEPVRRALEVGAPPGTSPPSWPAVAGRWWRSTSPNAPSSSPANAAPVSTTCAASGSTCGARRPASPSTSSSSASC